MGYVVKSAIGVGKLCVEVYAFIQDNTAPVDSRRNVGLRDITGGSFVGCEDNIKLAELLLRHVAALTVVNVYLQ